MESKLSQFLRDTLSTVEDGEPNEAKIAKNLVDIATGRKGSTRDQLQAMHLVYDRIEGKPKSEAMLDFLNGMKKIDAGKYRRPIEIEGEAEVVTDVVIDDDNLQ